MKLSCVSITFVGHPTQSKVMTGNHSTWVVYFERKVWVDKLRKKILCVKFWVEDFGKILGRKIGVENFG